MSEPRETARQTAMKALKTLREWEALEMLQRRVDGYKTQKEAAEAFGVSPQHLSDVLNERRAITSKIALGLGYERQALFVPLEHRA